MPTKKSKQLEFKVKYEHLKDTLIIKESRSYDKSGMPVYDMFCPICGKYRGKLRMQAAFLPCKQCGQLGKKSGVKGKTRSDEFKRKIANGNLQYKKSINPGYKLRTKLEEKIVHNMRSRLWQALKGLNKSEKTLNLLGCPLSVFRQYIEDRFYPNPRNGLSMTWENLGRCNKYDNTWQIDHIKPFALFDLSDPVQLKEACHYTNLQPMWAEDNLRKGDRYDKH